MTSIRVAPLLLLLLICLGACGQAAATGPRPPAMRSPVTVVIPGADRFSPAVVEVTRGEPVVVRNRDTDEHTVTSVPGDPASFDLQVVPGGSATLVLDRPGIYRFYCRLHARYDAATGQVAALPSADHPAEPMSGVVVVTAG